ncbi:hypothetical protein F4813DRAFT_356607 [Daldinia decipiens]|uniref:uncharacterized protein n=1 Tax=Daldinia decipiens TaxID=326647 RepID=UPI0020C28EEC|nr:uncharacterized protein F4813DRAFT_356607 [Daldinia decipiens]KAI1658377.1 hypothetical protein F4813DRAFT_356607 [Daldinia decipiens]
MFRNPGSDKVLFDVRNNPQVASWVAQVPKLEYNQSQEPSGRPRVNLNDENVRLVSPPLSFHTPIEKVVEQDLIGFDQQQTEELSTSIDKENERISITQSETQVPQHPPPSKPERDDPFIQLWKGAQIGEPRVEPSITPPPRRSTMRQQAGRRYDGFQAPECPPGYEKVHKGPDPDPELTQAIVKKLVRMMGSLETFTGKVSLKAELGRFCLTKVNHNHVWLKGSACQDKVKSLQDVKEILDRHHVRPKDVIFTKFLTGDGEDANHITFAHDSFRRRLWVPTARRTVYEIYCRVKTADEKVHKLALEVDAKELTYRIYERGGGSCAVFVHCPMRVWDFQVTLTKSQDLGLTYREFAEDLINNMSITQQDSGIPFLEFVVKGVYQAEIVLVRTRNIASYTRNGACIQPFSNTHGSKSSTSSILEICEVHDMAPRIIGRENGNVTILFDKYDGDRQRGQLPIWYEVSLQSKVINKALQQNQDLEIGEEVSWTPQQLQKAGAFDEIITSAIEVVKNIDGVGYWGDNFQDAKNYKMPPSGTETYLQHPTSKRPL